MLRPNHKKDDELLKSIREIGNLSLNRINLLGMLQRAFNSLQKKTALSLLYPCRKSSALALRGRERGRATEGGGATESSPIVHPLFAWNCLPPFHAALPFPIPVPYCSIFLAFWFCSVSAQFYRHRWWVLKQTWGQPALSGVHFMIYTAFFFWTSKCSWVLRLKWNKMLSSESL